MQALEELNKLIENETYKTVNSYTKEYRESKWYREPSLRDVFGDVISSDIKRLKESLEKESDVRALIKEFEETAMQYGKSWYDEDLGYERTGYEYETKMYITLRNIAARKESIKPADWEDYYEGFGK